MFIYKITNKVNGKVYIGQTRETIKTRFRGHLDCARRGDNRKLYCAMRKYGEENFEVSELERVNSIEELSVREGYWISHYNSIEDGYNMTFATDNPMNYPEIAQKHESKMRSESVRSKISSTMKEYVRNNGFSEEHRRRISESMRGNTNFAGHKRSEYAKECSRKSLIKSVYCVDKEGNLVNTFGCVRDAALWWYDYDKFTLKHWDNLCNYIKQSSVNGSYVKSLRWFYGVPCVEAIERVGLKQPSNRVE